MNHINKSKKIYFINENFNLNIRQITCLIFFSMFYLSIMISNAVLTTCVYNASSYWANLANKIILQYFFCLSWQHSSTVSKK